MPPRRPRRRRFRAHACAGGCRCDGSWADEANADAGARANAGFRGDRALLEHDLGAILGAQAGELRDRNAIELLAIDDRVLEPARDAGFQRRFDQREGALRVRAGGIRGGIRGDRQLRGADGVAIGGFGGEAGEKISAGRPVRGIGGVEIDSEDGAGCRCSGSRSARYRQALR
jgi:hypothetical protein